MFQAGAIYEGRYLLGTSIARPCITKGMLEIAAGEGADAIAHGATGKGNDQVRFELSAAALAPEIKCIAPWRDARFREQFPGRAEMIAYAEANDIPVKASMKKPYSMDRNLLHISLRGRDAGGPVVRRHHAESDATCTCSRSPPRTPRTSPNTSSSSSRRATPSASSANASTSSSPPCPTSPPQGERDGYTLLTPYGVMRVLNTPRRRARRRPHRHRREPLRRHEIPRRLRDPRRHHPARRPPRPRGPDHRPRGRCTSATRLIPKYAQLVYNGFWFAPEREALQALVTETQKTVSGEVRVKLYKGNVMNAGRRSPLSLYSEDVATMEGGAEDAYNQDDATGFIALNALRLKAGR